MTPHQFTAIAAVVVAILLAGCVRDDLRFELHNDTAEDIAVTVVLLEADGGVVVYNQSHQMAPGTAKDLGALLPGPGDYHLEVTVNEGAHGERDISWSRQTGPDEVEIHIGPSGVSIDIKTL